MDQVDCDYLVIGAGASGCAVAARLSENPDNRVVLIEAGGPDRHPFFHIPAVGFVVSSMQRYTWNFVTDPISGLGGRRQIWLGGKVLGGSSSINGMVYTRGHSQDYDLWRQMGCTGWSFADVLPYFKRAEAHLHGEDAWHGGSGAMPIRPAQPDLPIYEAFLRAACDAGFPVLDDLNRDTIEGFGYYDVNIHHGRRISSARAYLGPARQWPNLRIMTNTEAKRLVLRDGGIAAAEVHYQGKAATIRAERETVLCAGAIKTSQLLLLSGIGPADDLRATGIEVVVDAPEVGRNLQNHVLYRTRYACSQPVTAYRYVKPRVAVHSALRYLLGRRGFLGESIAAAGGFFRTDPHLETPDAQVVLIAAPLEKKTRANQGPWEMLPKSEGFALTIYQGSPYSRGHVTLRSADPGEHPRVAPNYFEDPRDMDVLVAAVERMREMVSGPAMRDLISREIEPGTAVRTRAELAARIRENAFTAYHQCGTCRMGSDATAVVDPQLRVRGVSGLRVADTSIIPCLPNATLHAPAIMIGEKAAAMILGE